MSKDNFYTVINLHSYYSKPKDPELFHKVYSEMWDKFIHPFNKRLTENGGM